MTVIVNTIQCRVRRARAHVCEKVGEAASPTVADGDAAPAVQMVFRDLRVVASLLHAAPGSVLGGQCHAVSTSFRAAAAEPEVRRYGAQVGAAVGVLHSRMPIMTVGA